MGLGFESLRAHYKEQPSYRLLFFGLEILLCFNGSDNNFALLSYKTMKQNIIDRLNLFAGEKEPFLFVVNYAGTEAYIRKLSEIALDECLYDFEGITNVKRQSLSTSAKNPMWKVYEPNFEDYTKDFEIVKNNILRGNSYLTNLTCKVAVDCDLPFEEIFLRAKGKYKILLKNKKSNRQFVCFSPETFVRIKNEKIYSYPMKGTIDASIPNARQILMNDEKETAEHATIVDLIRNDLSRVAEYVRVNRYRYIDVLHTNKGGHSPDKFRNKRQFAIRLSTTSW